jgi:hypothetical protein
VAEGRQGASKHQFPHGLLLWCGVGKERSTQQYTHFAFLAIPLLTPFTHLTEVYTYVYTLII